MLADLPKNELKIIVLGPGMDQQNDLIKRKQILKALHDEGYSSSQLGEQAISVSPSLPLNIALLQLEADLILVLETGPAPLCRISYAFHLCPTAKYYQSMV